MHFSKQVDTDYREWPSPPSSKQCWDEETLSGQAKKSVQGCTKYNIAWGQGGKGEEERHIVLIIIRLLSPIVVRQHFQCGIQGFFNVQNRS